MAVAAEDLVRRDVDGDDQVALRAAVAAGVALAGDAHLGVVVHAGRDACTRRRAVFSIAAVAAAGGQGAPGRMPLPPQLGQTEPNFMNPVCF